MPSAPQITPLSSADIDVVSELLAARQRRLRGAWPNLPAAYEDPAACRPLVEALLKQDDAYGVLGTLDGTPFGFLLGHPRHDPIWGRAAWSPFEGSALADGADPELIRDLYATWSHHFVREGFFRQYIHAAVGEPELMAAWVRTGFGQMQAHAMRDLTLTADPPSGVVVRRARVDDIDRVEPLLPLIALALMRPPAYAISLPEGIRSYRGTWEDELADPSGRHWLAEQDGRALAMASLYDAEPGTMVPEGAIELAVAMTLPAERGRGLMRALLALAFAEAGQAGATTCLTDWRTASLPTHRSWTAIGFSPTHYRLHRHIDERIAWADIPGMAEGD
jgi:GNAT superfamily N-acetyltransferase